MCPGARIAGLGGPWGRMKRTNTRNIDIAAQIKMRRVIWRFAMLEYGSANEYTATWLNGRGHQATDGTSGAIQGDSITEY